MAIVNLFKRKPIIYGLTPRGKKRAEDSGGQTPEAQILCMLEEHGESSLKEVARETNIDLREVKFKLKKMERIGLVSGKAEENIE